MTVYTTRPLEWAALAGILILAVALRMGAPGIAEFRRDEANLSVRALNFVHGQESFPLLGIDSSVGIRNGPVTIWLLAIPYLFTSDPTIATQFIGLLNVISVLGVYWIARRYYGPLAAVVAGLLFAVSPWSIIYSRRIWNPDMLAIFIMLTLATGFLGFLEGKKWAQLVHLPLLALTGQIHYGTFMLIPITAYLIWVGRRRLTQAFALSIVLALLTFAPYVIGSIQSGSFTAESIQKVLAAGKASNDQNAVTFSDTTFRYANFVIAGTDLHQIIGAQGALDYLKSISSNVTFPILHFLPLAVIVAALWLMVRAVRRRDGRTPVDISLLLLLILTPAVYLVTWTRMNIYYLVPMLPAVFLVLGAAAHDLWCELSDRLTVQRIVFVFGSVLVIVIAGLQLWSLLAMLSYFNTHITTDGVNAQLNEYLIGSGTPLGYYMPPRNDVLAQHPQSVIASLDGQYIGYNEETTTWNALLYDVPLRRFTDDSTSVYPAEKSAYLSHNCTDSTRNYNLRPGEGCYAISTRQSSDFPANEYNLVPDEDNVHFANGARITAYRWNGNGCLSVVWTVDNGPRTEDFTFATHFLNANGDKIAQADSLSWLGKYWRAGDTIVKMLCSQDSQQKKNEIAAVRIGMYTFEDVDGVRHFYGSPLLDSQGKPAGDWVIIHLK